MTNITLKAENVELDLTVKFNSENGSFTYEGNIMVDPDDIVHKWLDEDIAAEYLGDNVSADTFFEYFVNNNNYRDVERVIESYVSDEFDNDKLLDLAGDDAINDHIANNWSDADLIEELNRRGSSWVDDALFMTDLSAEKLANIVVDQLDTVGEYKELFEHLKDEFEQFVQDRVAEELKQYGLSNVTHGYNTFIKWAANNPHQLECMARNLNKLNAYALDENLSLVQAGIKREQVLKAEEIQIAQIGEALAETDLSTLEAITDEDVTEQRIMDDIEEHFNANDAEEVEDMTLSTIDRNESPTPYAGYAENYK